MLINSWMTMEEWFWIKERQQKALTKWNEVDWNGVVFLFDCLVLLWILWMEIWSILLNFRSISGQLIIIFVQFVCILIHILSAPTATHMPVLSMCPISTKREKYGTSFLRLCITHPREFTTVGISQCRNQVVSVDKWMNNITEKYNFASFIHSLSEIRAMESIHT